MYLVIDIGNTNIKCGLYQQRKLLLSWRVYADSQKTSDEYGVEATTFLRHRGYSFKDVKGIIIASVKPQLNYTIEHMCEVFFDITPLLVSHDLHTGLHLQYDDPALLGADRIVNAVAALEKYGGPCITVDFGTATTLGAISRRGDFLGGSICPGIRISTDALIHNTSMLPNIQFQKPPSVICKDTISSMQSGIIYGLVGQVDTLVSRMKVEMAEPSAKVIATGGMSQVIASESSVIDVTDSLLTLEGLSILYLKNS
ncbi:MAG: type III pantothenate kinase [Christensenellales bacterium]|jgi:type III pantothenate kinase